MKFVRLSVYTGIERNAALASVRDAMSGCNGWIVDHTLFSNSMATIKFEIAADKVDALVARLKEADLEAAFDGDVPAKTSGELRGQLTLTFLHQDGDLKRDVPAFG